MAAQRHPGSVQVGPRDRRGRPGRPWRRFVARYRAQALHIGEGRPEPRVVEGGRHRLHPGGVDPAVVVGEHEDLAVAGPYAVVQLTARSEAHTSELKSLLRISYAVICLKKN